MTKDEAKGIIKETFSSEFNEKKFQNFIANLLKQYIPVEKSPFVKESFKSFVLKYKVTGYFEDSEGNKIDILEVALNKSSTLERARTAQRNFVAEYLKTNNKDAALVAFVAPKNKDWRLSLVKLENSLEVVDDKLKTKEEITPAKRWSFLVGENEGSHTAQTRFMDLLINDKEPNLAELEIAFDIEKVTKEFFDKYKELFLQLNEHLETLLEKDEAVKKDFEEKEISTVDFAKKTLGQIVFLYFLQKKGWFGVKANDKWGSGHKKFMRQLFEWRDKFSDYNGSFFNDILEPLFYEGLSSDLGNDYVYDRLSVKGQKYKMPFLNGGLFSPMNEYSWKTTDIIIPDELFSNNVIDPKTRDVGNGILDIFDRYNFTVNENELLEKEVAVDPEMLGKVFENLLDIKDRKSKGSFYTPREIVHYMCQESLINYLETGTKNEIPREDLELFIRKGDRIIENDKTALEREEKREARGVKYTDKTYPLLLPKSVRTKSEELDQLLKDIKVADPAVGSGAFPLGMINEIVRARKVLNIYLKKETSDYILKKYTITHSIYGVDIDPGAVEIAKLRLWLALVVDEQTPHPLPNLEHKIMQGNSLISEYEGIKLFDENIFEKEKKEGAEQMALGLGKTSSEVKMEELRQKTEQFINESQRSKKQKLKEDIDNLKWELIETTLAEQGKLDKLKDIKKYRKSNTKPFFIWKLEFSDVFKEKGGFDVVIGNPPYVGEKGNKDIFRPLAKGNLGKFYQGKMDLFYFFFHLALELGRQNSQHAFITTNYYVTALGARKLRADLKERASIRNLINFNELKIFDSARGQHNLITIFSKEQNPQRLAQNCITGRTGNANEEILGSIVSKRDKETQYYEVEQEKLYDGAENYIRLGGVGSFDNPIERILEKIKDKGEILSKISDISCGCDITVSKITKKHLNNFSGNYKYNDGVFVVSADEIKDINPNDSEMNIFKKYIKNSDISKYNLKLSNDNLIYLKWDDDIDLYPNIKIFLRRFKDILDDQTKRYNERAWPWYAIHRPREEKVFNSPEKIIVPYRSKSNIFGYSELKVYSSRDVFYIIQKENSEIGLKYILALLNSKLYYQWLYYRGKRKGEMLELYQKPLSEIPIKKISHEEQEPFIDLVDQILTIASAPDYDPKNPLAKQKELEEQIDELVYKLYDLTEEEIKVVENK